MPAPQALDAGRREVQVVVHPGNLGEHFPPQAPPANCLEQLRSHFDTVCLAMTLLVQGVELSDLSLCLEPDEVILQLPSPQQQSIEPLFHLRARNNHIDDGLPGQLQRNVPLWKDFDHILRGSFPSFPHFTLTL
jgi:hypothetical protein